MSVGSVGSASSAYAYLQSLLTQQSVGTGSNGVAPSDPLTTLLSAFYPSGSGDQSNAAASVTPQTLPPLSPLSPDTLGALISAQGQGQGQSGCGATQSQQSQTVFSEFDTNGDGSISKSEFEAGFGSNADMSKVDGLFSALDGNGDGSISQNELTSASQASHAHHHHHHAHGAGQSQGQSGGSSPEDLFSSTSATDAAGATTQTSSNSDGSSTTTIKYADGSTVSMTTPAVAAASSDNSTASSGGQSADGNRLEKLISRQSQLLAAQSASTLTIA
jgi:hypothetical protein